MSNQLSINDFLNENIQKSCRFGQDFEDKADYGSNNEMKNDMDLYFKDCMEVAKKSIKGFWYLYGTQLERDKGPYIDFGTQNSKGIVVESTTFKLMDLDIPSYWNLRALTLRTLEEKYQYAINEEEQ